MPPGFEFPIQNEPVELWTTIAGDASGSDPVTDQRGAHFLRVIGRLKPGVTQEQAQAELTAIAARLEQQYPDKIRARVCVLESALAALVGDVRPMLLLLLGAVACCLADRVRERREPAACARHQPSQRDGDSRGAGREPHARDPPVADRKRVAVVVGRSGRTVAGGVVVRSSGRARQGRHSARASGRASTGACSDSRSASHCSPD